MNIGLHSGTYLGLWHDGPGLTPLEIIRRARQFGYDGIELDGRRPQGNPLDLDSSRRRSIRETCAELDLDVAAVSAYSSLITPVIEHRESQLLMLRELIRLARDLGAPLVRLFLAWPGVALEDGIGVYQPLSRPARRGWGEAFSLDTWNTAKRCLREAVRYADDEDIYLALQNQPGPAGGHRNVLDMVLEIDSPRLRAGLDAAYLEWQDGPALQQAVQEVAPLLLHAHCQGEFARSEEVVAPARTRSAQSAVALPAFVSALREAGFNGYLCFGVTRPAIGSQHELLGIEHLDEQAMLALEYLRGLLAVPAPTPAEPEGSS